MVRCVGLHAGASSSGQHSAVLYRVPRPEIHDGVCLRINQTEDMP